MSAPISIDLSVMEAAHLASLLTQFTQLLSSEATSSTDPALRKLFPDAYRDDPAAASEFRRLTEGDLRERRITEIQLVHDDLLRPGPLPSLENSDGTDRNAPHDVSVAAHHTGAWLRTLNGLRLIIAERLGISETDGHAPGDPAFGVYDWLGYRLDLLVETLPS